MQQSTSASLQASTPQKITKKIAAERLGVSERTVLALAARGSVKAIKQRGENGQMSWSFDAGDVERYLWELKHPEPASTKALVKVTQAAPVIASAATLKPWMTIKEAAEYTGLPSSLFIQLINRRQLPAFDVGPRPGGRYRISRAALDKLEAVL